MSAGGGDRIELRLEIAARPETCWEVLTSPACYRQWWGSHVELDARPGGPLIERWRDGDREVVTSGTVTIAEPPRHLQLDWADDDWPGRTLVDFRFMPEGDRGTRLDFSHSGWSIFDEASRQSLIEAHRSGWIHYLNQFGELAGTIEDRN